MVSLTSWKGDGAGLGVTVDHEDHWGPKSVRELGGSTRRELGKEGID